MVKLRQFFGLARLQFGMENAYRFDSLIWITIVPMFFVIQYFLWKTIYAVSGSEVIKGFTFSAMMTYYLLSHITTAYTSTLVDRNTASMVKSGKLIKELVRPISYFSKSFLNNLWYGVFRSKYVPLLLIIAYFLIPTFEYTGVNTVLYVISLILAILLRFTYAFLIGLSSFWVKEYFGIRQFKAGLFAFFSGTLIPLTFFPQVFQRVFYFFPFQYMLYVPINMFLGQYTGTEVLLMLGVQVMWIVIFSLAVKFVWKRALTKFMGVGV
jgi:ABC-2 type transport system permease protein